MHFLDNILIHKKLMAFCVIVSVVPVLLITILLTSKMQAMLYERTIKLTEGTFNQLNQNFINMLTEQKIIIDSLMSNSVFNNYLNTEYIDSFESFTDYMDKAYPLLNRYNEEKQNLRIKIFNNNQMAKFSSVTNNSLEDLLQTNWYDPTSIKGSGYYWANAPLAVAGKKVNFLYCYRNVRYTDNINKIKMVIAVAYSEQAFYSLIQEEKDKVIFLCNPKGDIFTCNVREYLNCNLYDLPFDDLEFDFVENYNSSIRFNDISYLLLRKELNEDKLGIKGWSLLYMIPQQKFITESRSLVITSLLLCCVSLVFSLFFILVISKSITRRLKVLVDKIHKITLGNFNATETVSGKDEIAQINKDFDYMVDRINFFIQYNNEAHEKIAESDRLNQRIEIEKKEAEYLALQGQINPHFLFNTLETVRMNLILKDDRSNANIIRIFSEIIREYTNTSHNYVVIADEIVFVQKYIIIQKYRFSDKLNFILDINSELHHYLIPRLMIQPLIENAVHHGIELKSGTGTIRLSIRRDLNMLYIIVSDDGVGMEQSQLNALLERIYGKEVFINGHTQLALRNVYNRVHLMYGNKYGLSIQSKKDCGTTVTLTMPVNELNLN